MTDREQEKYDALQEELDELDAEYDAIDNALQELYEYDE